MSESKETNNIEQPIAPAAEEAVEEVAVTAEPEAQVEAATEAVEETVVEPKAEAEEVEPAEPVPSMDEFENEIEASMSRINVGDIVDCKVISVNEEEIIVNLGYVADGIITKSDLHVPAGEVINDHYSVDDELKAEVVTLNDGEGNVALSVKKADQIIVWDELAKAFEEKTNLTVTITDVVKGGVVANIKGVRAFMPASMISVAYVEDLTVWKGKELKVIVKDFDREDKKVIISHKEIDREERAAAKSKMLADLEKDQVFNGTVKKLMNFGAFVDIGGVDGLVHINEMSWKRIKHPSDVMKEGDVVEVYVISVDKENEKISLGLKNIGENPWDEIFDLYPIGKVIEGEVVRLAGFGAFVQIGDGIEGLVHISEISHDRVKSPADVLNVGDKVNVKVMTIDKEGQKIGLSIKETTENEEAVELAKYATDEEATTSLKNVFGDIMKHFEE